MANWQKYAAEAYGTFVLVLFGTGAALGSQGDYLVISLAFGLALVVGLYTVGRVSGGHFNPAVSLGMFLDKRIEAMDMVVYWVSQAIGAVLASLALAYLASKAAVGQTVTGLGGLEAFKGLVVEAILTAVFVMAILVMAKSTSYMKFLGIGLTLTTVHLVGLRFTGSSVNPARSFGPALVSGTWTDFWVYVVGPLVGAVIAWVLYKVIVTGDTNLADDAQDMMG
jgi:aquaporin Z